MCIATQQADWVDTIRYLRGMQPVRRRRQRRPHVALFLLALTVATVLAAISELV